MRTRPREAWGYVATVVLSCGHKRRPGPAAARAFLWPLSNCAVATIGTERRPWAAPRSHRLRGSTRSTAQAGSQAILMPRRRHTPATALLPVERLKLAKQGKTRRDGGLNSRQIAGMLAKIGKRPKGGQKAPASTVRLAFIENFDACRRVCSQAIWSDAELQQFGAAHPVPFTTGIHIRLAVRIENGDMETPGARARWIRANVNPATGKPLRPETVPREVPRDPTRERVLRVPVSPERFEAIITDASMEIRPPAPRIVPGWAGPGSCGPSGRRRVTGRSHPTGHTEPPRDRRPLAERSIEPARESPEPESPEPATRAPPAEPHRGAKRPGQYLRHTARIFGRYR